MRLHVLVRGEVQGVGYRWFARSSASRLGISGWVCNLSDGDVELELEGEEAPIREFLRVLKTGHPYARVSSLQTRELTGTGKYSGFEIR